MTRPPLSRARIHALLFVGTALITASLAIVDDAAARMAYANLYVLIGLFAAYFLSTRATRVHVAIALAGFALVLDAPARPAAEWLLISGVLVIATVTLRRVARDRALVATDGLTGLHNRTGLERVLTDELRAHSRTARPLALISLDLDRFSEVNEREGVNAGDALLCRCANEWQAVVGATGTVTRTGGDTFEVVLPNHTLPAAAATVERLQAACPPGRTCTAGLAAHQAGDSVSLLLGRATTARYEAKRAGDGQMVTLGADDHEDARLDRAITRGELTLRYQPIVSLSDGRIVGAEALVRWQHPHHGLLGPAEFVPLAEASGGIHALGRWALTRACEDAAAWHADRPHAAPVRVG